MSVVGMGGGWDYLSHKSTAVGKELDTVVDDDYDDDMEVKTLRCDECGVLRANDSNHWFEGESGLDYVAVHPVGTVVEKVKRVHLCGQACAMKWVAVKIGEL